MAASMDNRGQPENPEGEQRTEQVRPRPRLRQEPPKQLLGQDVTHVPFQSAERRMRQNRVRSQQSNYQGSEAVANFREPNPKENPKTIRRVQGFARETRESGRLGTGQTPEVASLGTQHRLPSGIRRQRQRMSVVANLPASATQTSMPLKPGFIKQLTTRYRGQQSLTPPPHLKQLRSGSESSLGQLPTFKRTRKRPLPKNSGFNEYRTQQSAYTREENQSASSSRINPWAVNPNSPLQPETPSYQEGNTGRIQNPRSIDASRGRKGRNSVDSQEVSVRSKPSTALGNGQREQNRSRKTAAVPSVPAQGRMPDARGIRQNPSAQSSQGKKNQTSRRPQKRSVSPFVYIIRMLILGIGIGAIAGTLLSALDPATQASVKAKDPAKTQIQETPKANSSPQLPVAQEILPLKAKIQALVAQNPKLQPGVFLIDLDMGAYLNLDANSSFAAASTIKLPILVAFFKDVDEGKIRLDETLTMKPEMMVAGSGDLQYKQPGSQYTALEVATKMITISDNTATNMIVARLGGAEVLNQRFRSWGLTATVLRNPLPDIEGTNTTSPQELANLLSIVNRGDLVSMRSRDRILDIMQQTQLNTLLPKGLGTGATIAHKTGTIGSLLADVGLVDMPTGKRYIIAVMVKRSHNDSTAEELIRQISRTAYEYFNQPRATPSTTSMPARGTATLTRAIVSENYIN